MNEAAAIGTERATLTPEEQILGRRLMLRFFSFNGITIAALLESFLILYAIRNGLSDPMVAITASFMQATMVFMPLGYRMVRTIGLARTWSICWTLRAALAAFMITAPWFAVRVSQSAAEAAVMIGAFGFALFKAIGLAAQTPLIGEIAAEHERGRFMAAIFTRDNLSYLITTVAIAVAIWISDALWIYQLVLAVGCASGVVAGIIIVRVPESDTPRRAANAPVWQAFRRVFGERQYRRTVAAWAAGWAGVGIVQPVSVIAVKNGYGQSDSTAVFLGLLFVGGGLLSARVGAAVSDRVGARLLLMFYTGILVAVGLFWALAPTQFSFIVVGVVFFLIGVARGGVVVETGHYLLGITTHRDRMGVALATRMLSGAFTGFCGSVLVALLLSRLAAFGLVAMPLYRTFFWVMLPLLALFYYTMTLLSHPLRPVAEGP